ILWLLHSPAAGTAEAHALGVVMIDGHAADLQAIEVDAYNRLIAIDASQGDTQKRLVRISVAAPHAASNTLGPAGSVRPGSSGLTSDGQGRFYSIQDRADGARDLLIASGVQVNDMDVDASGALVAIDDSP